ncbi:MAG: metal-dependent transcriptional regulator, partial [bacterium]
MPTISKEDYLKTIYNQKHERGGVVSTSQLANILEVSNAATSEMAKKLSIEGYVQYQKYKGLELTSDGEKVALEVIRRHRLWELFLMRVLNLSWSEVHDEAEHLEHNTTEFLINKIDEYLGNPHFDPHGSPIPDKNGAMPAQPILLQLNQCELNRYYILARVADENSELVNYFTKIGLMINSKIMIKQ